MHSRIVKEEYSVIIFLISPQKHMCEYSLEAPHRGASNGEVFLMSTHTICFYGELEKIIP